MQDPSKWYYVYSADQQLGPFPLEKIEEMLNDGSLAKDCQVWAEGMKDWQPVASIRPEPVLANDPVPSRPFEPHPLRERSFVISMFGGRRKEDAKAALETRLAEGGISDLSPQATLRLLKNHRLSEKAVKEVTIDVWQHALGSFITDDGEITPIESNYLESLQKALGLTSEEVANATAAVVNPELLQRAKALLNGADAISQATLASLNTEAEKLKIAPETHKQVLGQVVFAVFHSKLTEVFARRRLSSEELSAVLAFREFYGLAVSDTDNRTCILCWLMWLLDSGDRLPEVSVQMTLHSKERCVGSLFAAALSEMRKVRREGRSWDEWRQIDAGVLYLTTERMIYVGQAASKPVPYDSIVGVQASDCAFVVNKLSGKSQMFRFQSDLDREVVERIIERGRRGGLTAVALGAEPTIGNADDRSTSEPRQTTVAKAKPQNQGTETIERLLKELDVLTGLIPVKREVHSLVNYLRVQRLRLEQGLPTGQLTIHLVFTGNPGTGKTTVARLLAKIYRGLGFLPDGHLVETDRSGVVGGYLGQTALKTAEVVKKAIGGILFIDEAYALARSSNRQEGDSYGTEAIDTLLKMMEDNHDKLVVIVAGYREPMQQFLQSNPGLGSRFTRYIDFPDYTPDELLEIFQQLVTSSGYQLSDAARAETENLFTLAYNNRSNTFGNGRFARTVFEQACIRLADRLASDTSITREELTLLHPEDISLPATGGMSSPS